MVIKRELAEKHPWALTNILKAFNEANALAEQQRAAHVEYHVETGLISAEAGKALGKLDAAVSSKVGQVMGPINQIQSQAQAVGNAMQSVGNGNLAAAGSAINAASQLPAPGALGSVLGGVSLGNYLGGRAADRWPHRSALALVYVAASLATLLVLALLPFADSPELPSSAPAILQVLWLTALMFFVPSAILGYALGGGSMPSTTQRSSARKRARVANEELSGFSTARPTMPPPTFETGGKGPGPCGADAIM